MHEFLKDAETGATLEYLPLPGPVGTVIICPGGGYSSLSYRESHPVARAFRAAGWQANILGYAVKPPPLGTLPLRQLAWAVRAVRREADRLGNPGSRVVVCGFSAGGHLAASLGVHWNDKALFPDNTLRALQRPDGQILCYPVITAGEYAHRDSIHRLSGSGDPAYFSLEHHVSKETPPTFLWHTASDPTVPVQNALLFMEALLAHQVPVELHIYPRGTHGLSLATPEVEDLEKGRFADPHIAGWFAQCCQWLETLD